MDSSPSDPNEGVPLSQGRSSPKKRRSPSKRERLVRRYLDRLEVLEAHKSMDLLAEDYMETHRLLREMGGVLRNVQADQKIQLHMCQSTFETLLKAKFKLLELAATEEDEELALEVHRGDCADYPQSLGGPRAALALVIEFTRPRRERLLLELCCLDALESACLIEVSHEKKA